jgi:hypothetical protein
MTDVQESVSTYRSFHLSSCFGVFLGESELMGEIYWVFRNMIP